MINFKNPFSKNTPNKDKASMNKDEVLNEATEQEEKSNETVENQEATNTEAVEENKTVESKETTDTTALKAEIEKLKAQYEESKNKHLRLMAEFDNYKKRTSRERIDLLGTAAADTFKALLPVVDDFERVKKAGEADDNVEPLSEGVLLVYNKFVKLLAQKNVKAIESTGLDFNPDFHEALTEIPAPTEDMKGKVIDTIEKGYTLNDKIIRFARVVVGK